MQRALIIGESGGIGTAFSAALREHGVAVTGLSRSRDGLDLTDETSVDRILDAIDGPFDLLLIATGALVIGDAEPEKRLRAVTAQAMHDQFALNAVGPALVLRHAARLLPRNRRSVCAALSARVGSIGDNRLGGWISYRTSKAALNQIVHTASIELAGTHPEAICISLHPGTVETPLTARHAKRYATVPPREAAENLLSVINGLSPEDTGGFFDWAGKPVPW